MQNIINTLVFILILGSIITIHELGHLLAAKYFGVYCSQFSIGFGPKIYSRKGKETDFEIRALPIGGFVAMAGEEGQEDQEALKDVPYERTLKGKKTHEKIIIFLAGVFMNFILAIVVIFGINLTAGELPVNVAQIGSIVENSAAEVYELMPGDIIEKIEVLETGDVFIINNFNDIELNRNTIKTTSDSLNLELSVKRNDVSITKNIVVKYNDEAQKYAIGIVQATRSMTFTEAFKYTFITFGEMSFAIVDALGQLVTNFTGTVGQLSGPVGIYETTAKVTETGDIAYILSLLAMLSINIGVFNLMPIPGLDGCQMLFAIVEHIIGRELPEKLRMILQIAGLALVFGLMIIVTFQDIFRIFL